MARHADSLGVHLGGKPETVTIEFQPEAAPYVAEREYHASQSVEMRRDGCLVLKMRVAVDFALVAWVLGFGPRARVLAPRRLAQVVLEQIEETRANYAPTLPGLARSRSARSHKRLPFTTKAR
jgi:predicted DNA-binding transcriptional regulator YafY